MGSVAPASDIIATPHGFLLLGTRIDGDCYGKHAKGLTPGDAPWFFLDGKAKLHRLGWSSTEARRDINVGSRRGHICVERGSSWVCEKSPCKHSDDR